MITESGQSAHEALPAAGDGDRPALELRGVSKIYPDGTRALAGADLAVASGETLALVGESGCGKTTLLRLFNRMVEPTAGEVLVGDRLASELDPIELRRHTGYVQQEGGLIPHWTVRDNVELVPRLLGWDEGAQRRRADELLAVVKLPAEQYAERYPVELSGGQRQRVAFARALGGDPPVVLLDEPFGALDALTRLELQDQFMELKEELGKTLLLVTHDLEEAFRLADRIGVMKEGELLQVATPRALRDSPAAGYVEELIELATGSPEERPA